MISLLVWCFYGLCNHKLWENIFSKGTQGIFKFEWFINFQLIEEALSDLFWKAERATVNEMNITTVSKTTLRKCLSERWDGAHVGFSESIDIILNWTELA